MAVHSKRLFGPTQVSTSTVTLYTCPAGKTAIIKQINIFNQSATPQGVGLFIDTADAAHRIFGQNVTGGQSVNLTDWFCVLQPGQSLKAQSQSSNCTYEGSGAELDGVAP